MVDRISTYIIGRESLLHEAWRRLLDGTTFDLVGTGCGVDDLLIAIAEGYEPKLVILDVVSATFDVREEIGGIQRMAHADTRIAVVASGLPADTIGALLSAGADGYLDKNIQYEALLESLRLIMLGEKVYPVRLLADVLDGAAAPGRSLPGDARPATHLSPREQEILRFLAGGHSNKMIARRLEINEPTVKVHLRNILRKLHLANRTQAAVWAVSAGLAGADCGLTKG